VWPRTAFVRVDWLGGFSAPLHRAILTYDVGAWWAELVDCWYVSAMPAI
jgi:hypothetical protein